MGQLLIAWWVYYKAPNRIKIAVGAVFGVIGCILMAIAYWVDNKTRTGLFLGGQVLITVDFALATEILLKRTFALTLLKKEDLNNTFKTRK